MTEKKKCPHCKKNFAVEDKRVLPFCSERCQLIDLGNWLDETYNMPAYDQTEDE